MKKCLTSYAFSFFCLSIQGVLWKLCMGWEGHLVYRKKLVHNILILIEYESPIFVLPIVKKLNLNRCNIVVTFKICLKI